MQLIKENFGHDFDIEKRGLCSIFITARCKSKKQTRGVDEDLRVEIDNQSFREIPPEKNIQLYNIPASWNGSKLKGLKKTVVFILWLEKGSHKITFIPRKEAKLENIEIKELGQNIKHRVFDINERAEDGDRRPWYTFALIGLPLKYLSVEVTVQKRFWDSDDVKVIIDGKVKRSIKGGKHKFWYFVGGILPWIIWRIVGKSKRIKAEFNESLVSGIHYLEVHADRTPVLHNVELDFGEEIEVKRIPTVDDPGWTEDFKDDPEEILLARVIYGEAGGVSKLAKTAVAWSIKNRVNVSKYNWGDNYHDVILQEDQYDALWNKHTYDKVRNPLIENKLEKEAWQESYHVALQVINNETKDPTKGANHFYSTDIDRPYWANEEKLIFSVDTFKFYKL